MTALEQQQYEELIQRYKICKEDIDTYFTTFKQTVVDYQNSLKDKVQNCSEFLVVGATTLSSKLQSIQEMFTGVQIQVQEILNHMAVSLESLYQRNDVAEGSLQNVNQLQASVSMILNILNHVRNITLISPSRRHSE